jgi:hypothetical protein
MADISDLIDRYWLLAYAEGVAGATTDTEAGDAEECRIAIDAAIAALRARCEKAEADLKYESDRGDEWFEKATYEVGGAPQLWSDRATAAESRCEAQDRRIAELEAALTGARAKALGDAIDAVKRSADPSTFVMTGPSGILRQAAAAIRALIPEREG